MSDCNVTPAGSTVELDGVPGSRIPTERLEDTPGWRAGEYRDDLLLGVYYLLAGRGGASARDVDSAVRTASEVIRRVERFCAGPTPPTPPDAPARVIDRDDQSYLLWLSNFSVVPPSAVCPVLGPDASASSRRRLLARGLIASSKWEDSHGYAITPAGRVELSAAGRSTVPGGLSLAGQEEAA